MILSNSEVSAIKEYLTRIEQKERVGMRKYYATNQIRNIRKILNKAERREKGRLL